MDRSHATMLLDNLGTLHFPISKAELIDAAEMQNAPQEVLDDMMSLPDTDFFTMEDLARAAGGDAHDLFADGQRRA